MCRTGDRRRAAAGDCFGSPPPCNFRKHYLFGTGLSSASFVPVELLFASIVTTLHTEPCVSLFFTLPYCFANVPFLPRQTPIGAWRAFPARMRYL
jgi:hypothetical protein